MMRKTDHSVMQEFCEALFDKVDALGYDVSLVPHGDSIWQVNIENATTQETYCVEHCRLTGEWRWIRVITV